MPMGNIQSPSPAKPRFYKRFCLFAPRAPSLDGALFADCFRLSETDENYTNSKANPFKYSVSGMDGMIGWSGD